ncbi:uncharacterized protein MONBRDRAFT_13994, partial [Monosiga brevicollis MX1]
LPALSPTMTEGSIVAWKAQEGDEIMTGDVLFEIETDKATMAVESIEDGVLRKIIIGDGTSGIPLNTIVGYMTESADEEVQEVDEQPAESKPAAKADSQTQAEAQTEAPSAAAQGSAAQGSAAQGSAAQATPGGQPTTRPLSPAVRALVDKHGLDVSQIPATGPKNYLLKGDVLAFMAGEMPAAKPSTSAKSEPTSANARKRKGRGHRDIPASNMRKTISKRLTESKGTKPHTYTKGEADITELLQMRKRFKEQGINFSVNDMVIKAAALALRQVPAVNASLGSDGEVQLNNTVDISVAVAIDAGLITPIIFNADALNVPAISSAMGALAAKARSGKLQPHEYQGGTFSISNLGMFGITHFTAVINDPQSSILAVGSAQKRPTPDAGPRDILTFQLSCDERVISQDQAAEYLKVLASYLQNPAVVMAQQINKDFE